MGILCRWILVLTLLLAAGPRLWAASAADRAFDAAAKAFQDTFYDRAEAEFADFCQKFPTSPRLAEAILLQAEARLELTNYAGAIELLSAHQGAAGTNADQYLFWLAEAHVAQRGLPGGQRWLCEAGQGVPRVVPPAGGEHWARRRRGRRWRARSRPNGRA